MEENANEGIKVYRSQWTPHINSMAPHEYPYKKTWNVPSQGEKINFNLIMGHNGPNSDRHYDLETIINMSYISITTRLNLDIPGTT